jgi:molecular chaperone HscB
MSDHFEVFGLPRKLRVDEEALQRAFYELSRRHHPDFHARAAAAEQAQALEASARLNAAYRTLRDPIARVEYLVRLEEGRTTKEGAADRPKAPPELLAEMFEIQEALAEARGGGLDDGVRETLTSERQRLRERQAAEEAALSGSLTDAWDAASDAAERQRIVGEMKVRLGTRAYLRTVIADLDEALEAAASGAA